MMTKTQAIKLAKQLAKQQNENFMVVRNDNDSRYFFVLLETSYWNDPTIDERDCVYSTVDGHYR